MDTPEFYAAMNASDNITRRLAQLGRAMICHQGDTETLTAIITETLILVGIDLAVMMAYRERLIMPATAPIESA